MGLDIRTLVLLTVVFELFLAGLMLQYRRHRKVYPGFEQWTLAAFSFALLYLSVLVRPFVPLWCSVLGVGVGAGLGVLLRWDGILCFLGRERLATSWYLLPAVLGVLLNSLVGLGVENVHRNLVLSLVTASIIVAYTRPLLATRGGSRVLCVSAATLSIVQALTLLARAVAWYQDTRMGMLDPSVFQFFFNAALVCDVCINAVFMLMNSQRLEQEMAEAESRLASTLEELREARDGLRILSGVLSFCSQCKKVQALEDSWERMEVYVSRHTDVEFSHGLCTDCLNLYYPAIIEDDPDLDREAAPPGPIT